jgi:hypothetical protein
VGGTTPQSRESNLLRLALQSQAAELALAGRNPSTMTTDTTETAFEHILAIFIFVPP